MEHVKFLILGAGPAGLSFARRLADQGEDSFLVLEKEQEAGGLCRSVEVDGAPFDIGGGHFLDVRRPQVNEFLFRFLPKEEWLLFERDSRIKIRDTMINHPFEANIWQMDLEDQVAYLLSAAQAGCSRGDQMPELFIDWIRWKLGDKIAEDYMIPYNRKMFADELNTLGVYWLEKLPNVSFEETLRSCLEKKPYGQQPGHAEFYYPEKYGYGEVWLRMADSMAEHMIYGQTVSRLDTADRIVTSVSGEKWRADHVITTIPWTCFEEISGMEEELFCSIKDGLKHSAIETRYVGKQLDTPAQWIYVPDETVPYHRILIRHNFCKNSRGYWLETRQERTAAYAKEAEESGAAYHYLNEYAYPLNTIGKPQLVKKLLAFCESRDIYGLGRWGEHSHYNSDLVVELAVKKADALRAGE